MAKIVVVLSVQSNDGTTPYGTDEVDGSGWSVDPNGVLTVVESSGNVVASYPNGKWWRVKREETAQS